jgi:hypothetical protein
VLTRAGLPRLSDLAPNEPAVRYEHDQPGDLLHIDTKKLGRIVRMGHRVTGDPRDRVDGAGFTLRRLEVAGDGRSLCEGRRGFSRQHSELEP